LQVLFWQDQSSSSHGRAVFDIIQPLNALCQNLAVSVPSLTAAHQDVDSIHSTLIQLWDCQVDGHFTYPQPRMEHLLALIGRALVSFCQRALSSPEAGAFWERDSASMRSDLAAALELLRLWHGRVQQLMRDWIPGVESISQHAWQGLLAADTPLQLFVDRLEQIRGLVELRSELLASVQPGEEGGVRDAFASLHDINCLQARCLPQLSWLCHGSLPHP
jgi:hypothetical protein